MKKLLSLLVIVLSISNLNANNFLVGDILKQELIRDGIVFNLKVGTNDVTFISKNLPAIIKIDDFSKTIEKRIGELEQQSAEIEDRYDKYPKTIDWKVIDSQIQPLDSTINIWLQYEMEKAENTKKQSILKKLLDSVKAVQEQAIVIEYINSNTNGQWNVIESFRIVE